MCFFVGSVQVGSSDGGGGGKSVQLFLQLLLTWSKKLFNKEQNSHLLLFGYAKRDKWSLKRTDEQAMANLGERMFNGQTN